MKTFVAIRSSFGFQGRLWEKGQQVQAEKLPNEHFRALSTDVEKAQEAADKAALLALEAGIKAKELVAKEEKEALEAAAQKITGKKQ